MVIFLCYTETLSEPHFKGYIVGKRKALQWVKDEVEYSYPDQDMELDVDEDKIQADNGEHYVIAVKLNKLVI